jgi:hypothetical protein
MTQAPTLVRRDATPYIAMAVTAEMTELDTLVPRRWADVAASMAERGLTPSGPPLIRYLVIDMPARMEVHVGFPVREPEASGHGLVAGVVPAGRYATLVHDGPVEGLVAANEAVQRWARDRGIELQSGDGLRGSEWEGRLETYLSGPEADPETQSIRAEVAYLLVEAGDA